MALRTLRQRPKVVDHTPDGQPVYEVRSVRLVLPADATHFKQLVTCSRCGKEVAGAPVLEPGDLERPPQPVICRECVEAAGMSVVPSTERRYVPPKPVEDVAPAAESGEDDEALRAELHAAVAQGLADVRAQLAASTDATGKRVGALEGRLAAALDEQRAERRAQSVALTGVLEGQRSDLEDGLTARVSLELAAVRAAVTELVRSQGVIEGRLNALAQHASAMEARVDTLSASADAVAGAQRAPEQRVEASLDSVTALVEAHRRELDARLVGARQSGPPPPTAPGPVGGNLLDALEQQLQEAEGRWPR